MQGYGQPAPPAGQQVIGVLNIVFGILGAIPWALALLGGSLMTAAGGAVGASGGQGSGTAGGLVAAGGVLLMVFSLAFMALSVLLIVAGVGVLKTSPSGRNLSLLYAWIAIGLNVVNIVLSGFSTIMCNLVGLIYPIVLLVLMNQPDWKAAFSGDGGYVPPPPPGTGYNP